MKEVVAQQAQKSLTPAEQVRAEREELPPPPPSRLGWRLTWGVILEVLTIIAVMVTCASNQFSVLSYILALIGILIPLLLAAWGFWLMNRDEARSQGIMRAMEQQRLRSAVKDEQMPPTPVRELVYR